MIRRIAIFYGLYSSSARGILRGINAFARPAKPWVFRWTTQSPAVLPQIREWDPHGIIACVNDEPTYDALMALKKPVVDVGNCVRHPAMPLVTWRESRTGKTAAEHFLERGFTNFGFIGFESRAFSRERLASFRHRLRAEGFDCSTHLNRSSDEANQDTPSWRKMDAQMKAWIDSLPKPVGIFADCDGYAIELVEACRQAGVHVPDEVSILAVGDDETACHAVFPPLSSIKLHGEPVGFAAAELLERLMNGGKPPVGPKLFPPGDVMTRQSSDVVAIDQPRLAAAARYIRQHAHEGIAVKDVLKAVAIERRELERGFRRVLGHTPLREIHQAKAALARQMLETTDLPMPAIAPRAGFPDSKKMASVFKRITGVSPSAYRRQFQLNR